MIIAKLQIQLNAHPWLEKLTLRGYVWEKHPLDTEILIVAVDNDYPDDMEWAAYYQSPGLPAEPEAVGAHGRKLPAKVAKELFGFIKLPYRV